MGKQPLVACGDPSGEAPGCQSFSVKYPSPLYDKLQRNLVVSTPGPQHRYSEPRPTEATCRGKFQLQEKSQRGWYPYCLLHHVNAELLEKKPGPATVSGTRHDVWVLNESVLE